MENEVSALHKNKTWHLVPPKPGYNLIDCKWVFKVKRKQMVLLTDIREDWWQRA
jgi:hypothetical protein